MFRASAGPRSVRFALLLLFCLVLSFYFTFGEFKSGVNEESGAGIPASPPLDNHPSDSSSSSPDQQRFDDAATTPPADAAKAPNRGVTGEVQDRLGKLWAAGKQRVYAGGKSGLVMSETKESPNAQTYHDTRQRLRKATMMTDANKYGETYLRAVETHEKHGQKWGEPLHVLRHEIISGSYTSKPAHLLGIILHELAKPEAERTEWVVWVDADTLVINHEVPWSLFLPPADFDDIHFFVTKDQNGFNSGVFFMRVNSWSAQLLADTVALPVYDPEFIRAMPWHDQSTIWHRLNRTGNVEHFMFQPHNWFNAFGLSGEPFDSPHWMLHFAGAGSQEDQEPRDVSMARWLDLLDAQPDKYTVPLAQTIFPAEVESYWTYLRAARETLGNIESALRKARMNQVGAAATSEGKEEENEEEKKEASARFEKMATGALRHLIDTRDGLKAVLQQAADEMDHVNAGNYNASQALIAYEKDVAGAGSSNGAGTGSTGAGAGSTGAGTGSTEISESAPVAAADADAAVSAPARVAPAAAVATTAGNANTPANAQPVAGNARQAASAAELS